jgi:hypothetical protein
MNDNTASEEVNNKVPPYVPYQTFEAFIERIKGTVTPNRVDSSLVRHLSGSAQSQLFIALRYLGLTQVDGKVNPSFKELVAAYKTPEWKSKLADLVKTAYADLIGELDVTNATPAELKERFRDEGGVEGDTVEKCVRFYLMALKEADVKFSPVLKIRQRSPKGSSGARTRGAGRRDSDELDGDDDDGNDLAQPASGTLRLPFSLPGKPLSVIAVAKDITEQEWEIIDTYVRNYIILARGAKPKDPDDRE